MKESECDRQEAPHEISPPSELNVAGSLPLDIGKYRSYLADYPLSEAQQQVLLESLWGIMRTFVELGFGVDPVQQIFSNAISHAMDQDEAATDFEGVTENSDCAISEEGGSP